MMQIVEGPQSWAERIDELRGATTALPDLVEHAFIRPCIRTLGSWMQIASVQDLPDLHESDIRYNKHLLGRHVPDVHGVQVLRETHLDNAYDLSGWDMTDLGHGRHLVQARDLEPWYAGPLPDPDVVAAGRRDFGDMILTLDTIAANPPPWE